MKMVADAVAFELVSAAKFPADREESREFFEFGRPSRLLWPISQMILKT
jgi:hypothetical protein